MLRVAVVALLTMLIVPASAGAAVPCWKELLTDAYDGQLDGSYATECYRQALAHLPEAGQVVRPEIEHALLVQELRLRALRGDMPLPVEPVTIRRVMFHQHDGGVSTVVAVLIGVVSFLSGAYAALFVVSHRSRGEDGGELTRS